MWSWRVRGTGHQALLPALFLLVPKVALQMTCLLLRARPKVQTLGCQGPQHPLIQSAPLLGQFSFERKWTWPSHVWFFVTPWTEPTRLLGPWNSPAKILESVAIPISKGSSQFRNQAWVSRTASRFCTIWVTTEAPGRQRASLTPIPLLSAGHVLSDPSQSQRKH